MEPDSQAARDGKMLLIISSFSILIWLFISNGYSPNSSLLFNFYYSMNVIDVHLLCESPYNPYGSPDPSCWNFSISTKNAVLASLTAALYGYLIMRHMVSNPFPKIRNSFKAFIDSPSTVTKKPRKSPPTDPKQ
jgi:hypothetical protein